jgi:nitrate reductase cytochrome c-type subunit
MLQEWMRQPPLIPHNAESFNENMVKKLKIVAGVVVAVGVIAGIAGSQIKHKHRDSRDS